MKNYFGKTEKYDDIIYKEHPVSKSHPPMPTEDRAAQFAPFAALTGYGDAIKETSRLTEAKIELNEEQQEILNRKLKFLKEKIKAHPMVQITYYEPDLRKEGGSYRKVTGALHKVDEYRRILVMEDGKHIRMEDVAELEAMDFLHFV